MKAYHKSTILYVYKEDFYDRSQTIPDDFGPSDLNTSEKREAYREAAVVILLFNNSRYLLKSRY